LHRHCSWRPAVAHILAAFPEKTSALLVRAEGLPAYLASILSRKSPSKPRRREV
jgi:hypothetical protein